MTGMRAVVLALMAVLVVVGVVACAVTQTDGDEEAAGTEIAPARGPDAGPGPGDRRDEDADAMRQRLMAGGATEADVEAIEAYRTRQRELMEPLRQAMQSLREAGGEDATGAQAEQAIRDHEAAMKTALSELAKAEEALKARLSLSTKPKLHAMLLSMGVLDNGMRGMGGMRGRRPGGEGGRGARRGGGAPADERGGPRGGGAARGGRGGARGGGAAPGA